MLAVDLEHGVHIYQRSGRTPHAHETGRTHIYNTPVQVADEKRKHDLGRQVIDSTAVDLLPTVPVRQERWRQRHGVHVLEPGRLLPRAVSTAAVIVINGGSRARKNAARAGETGLDDPVLRLRAEVSEEEVDDERSVEAESTPRERQVS